MPMPLPNTRQVWKVRLYKGVHCDPTYKYLTPTKLDYAAINSGSDTDSKRIPIPLDEEGKELNYFCETDILSKVVPSRDIRFPTKGDAISFENIYDCNYLVAYPSNSTADFYYAGFIDDIEYTNDSMTLIKWTIDYWATYKRAIKNSTAPVVLDRALTASGSVIENAKGQLDENLPLTEPNKLTYTIEAPDPTDEVNGAGSMYYILYCSPVNTDEAPKLEYDANSLKAGTKETKDSHNLVSLAAANDPRSDSKAPVESDEPGYDINALTHSANNKLTFNKSKFYLDYNGQRGLDETKGLIDQADKMADSVSADYSVPDFSNVIKKFDISASLNGNVKGLKVYAIKNLTDTYLKPKLFFDANGCKIQACEVRFLTDDQMPDPISDPVKTNIYDLTDQLDKLYFKDVKAGFKELYQYHGKLPLIKGAQKMVIGLDGQEINFDLSAVKGNGGFGMANDLQYRYFDSIAPGYKPYYSFFGHALNRDQPLAPNYKNKDAMGLSVNNDRSVPLFADGVYKYLFSNQHRISAEITNKMNTLVAQIMSKKAIIEEAKQKAANDYKTNLRQIVNNLSAKLQELYRKNDRDSSTLENNSSIDAGLSVANNAVDQENLNNNVYPKEQGKVDLKANYDIGTNHIADQNAKLANPIKGNYDYKVEADKKSLLAETESAYKSNKAKNDLDNNNNKNDIAASQNDLTLKQFEATTNLDVKAGTPNKDKTTGRNLINLQNENKQKKDNLDRLQKAKVDALTESNKTSESNLAEMNKVEYGNLVDRSQKTAVNNLATQQKADVENNNRNIAHGREAIKRDFEGSLASSSNTGATSFFNTSAMNGGTKTSYTTGDNSSVSGIKPDNLYKLIYAKYGQYVQPVEGQPGAEGAKSFDDVTKDLETNVDDSITAAEDSVDDQWSLASASATADNNGAVGAINNVAQGEKDANNAVAVGDIGEVLAKTGVSNLLTGGLALVANSAMTGAINAVKANAAVEARVGAGSGVTTNSGQLGAAAARLKAKTDFLANSKNSDLQKSAVTRGLSAAKGNVGRSRDAAKGYGLHVGQQELHNLLRLCHQEVKNIGNAVSADLDSIKANYDSKLNIYGGDPSKDSWKAKWDDNANKATSSGETITYDSDIDKYIPDSEDGDVVNFHSAKIGDGHGEGAGNDSSPSALTTAAMLTENLLAAQSAARDVLTATNNTNKTNLSYKLDRALKNLHASNDTALKNLRDVINIAEKTNLTKMLDVLETNMKDTNAALVSALQSIQKEQTKTLKANNKLKQANMDNTIAGRVASLATTYNIDQNFINSLGDDQFAKDFASVKSDMDAYENKVLTGDGAIAKLVRGLKARSMSFQQSKDLKVALNEYFAAKDSLKITQSEKLEELSKYDLLKAVQNIVANLKKNKISITNSLNIDVSNLTIDTGLAIIEAENEYAKSIMNAEASLISSYYEASIMGQNDIQNYIRSFNAKLADIQSSSETVIPVQADWYAAKANGSYSPTISLFTQQPKDENRTLEYLKLRGLKLLARSTMKNALYDDPEKDENVLDDEYMPSWKPLKLLNSMVVGLPSKGQKALTEAFNNGVYINKFDK